MSLNASEALKPRGWRAKARSATNYRAPCPSPACRRRPETNLNLAATLAAHLQNPPPVSITRTLDPCVPSSQHYLDSAMLTLLGPEEYRCHRPWMTSSNTSGCRPLSKNHTQRFGWVSGIRSGLRNGSGTNGWDAERMGRCGWSGQIRGR